jgi:hypothetical protein
VLTTVAMATDKHATVGESKRCFLCGPFTGYIVQSYGDSYQSVMTSDGKGCHKSWLQQLEPESSEQEKRLSCCEL